MNHTKADEISRLRKENEELHSALKEYRNVLGSILLARGRSIELEGIAKLGAADEIYTEETPFGVRVYLERSANPAGGGALIRRKIRF